MMATFDAAPAWFKSALHEIGTREEGDNAGPAIRRYCAMAKCGAEGQPWCAIFANAMLESNGLTGTRSPSSQSFKNDPHFIKIDRPVLGCIVVFWRGSGPDSGIGHVGFYRGELNGNVYTLGGNEGDMVQIEPFAKSSPRFGLVGYYWPKSIPVPAGESPIIMPAGSPIHQTTVT